MIGSIDRNRIKSSKSSTRRRCVGLETAINEGRPARALQLLAELRRSQPDHPSLADFIVRAVEPIVTDVRSDVVCGRLDRAMRWQDPLQPVADELPEATELVDLLRRCRAVRRYLDQSRLVEAERELARLARLVPEADWISSACETLSKVTADLSTLHQGPLGLIDDTTCCQPFGDLSVTLPPARGDHAGRKPDRPVTAEPVDPVAADGGSQDAIPLVLQVDGMMSVLLLRGDRISIGAASQSAAVDVPLLTEGHQGSDRDPAGR